MSGQSTATNAARDALFLRWREHGDERAREQLFEIYKPLVRSIVRRYKHSTEPFEDLWQVAQLGLIKSLDGFDPDRGFAFTSYAVPTILGELRKHFRNTGWSVHVPRRTQERVLEVRDAERALTETNGRAPSVAELAEFLEVESEEILDALQAHNGMRATSLDTPRQSNRDEQVVYADVIGEIDDRLELVEMDIDLVTALKSLDGRRRELLRLRFLDELNQAEIAERFGVSQMQISRLLRRTLDELRELTGSPGELELVTPAGAAP